MRGRPLVPAVAVALLAAVGGAGAVGASGSAASPAVGAAAAVAPAAQAAPSARADFNGDGVEDLAVGVPFETVGSVVDAGTVNVLYGSPGEGLRGPGSQLFNQQSAGIASDPEAEDVFGLTLATGDFDGDGFTDLAIGAPGESVGSVEQAGVVQILYGSAGGLMSAGSQLLTQDTNGVGSTAEPFDLFGIALTSGDFDADGTDDLAIGAGGEAVGNLARAGAVNVLYGTEGGGLTGTGSTLLVQGGPVLPGEPETDDSFGSALASADFDADGFADLAVGAPGDSSGVFEFAGEVDVYLASATGIGLTQNSILTQESGGVGSNAEPFDSFGASLAAGDFDADGFADLAVGVPNESVGSVDGAGAVNILVGFEDGLNGRGGQLLAQNVGDVGSEPELFDSFGSALATGDFDGSGTADLAVGVPFESVGAVESAGVAHAFYGSPTDGLLVTGTQMFVQGSGGVGSTPEFPDEFGEGLGAADFDGDGHSDLAIGAPFESVGTVEQAGAIFVLDGTDDGLTGIGSHIFHQGVDGVGSNPEVFDGFGFSLAGTRPVGAFSSAATRSFGD